MYSYSCQDCGLSQDVIKSVREIDRSEPCPKCREPMNRAFAPARIFLNKTAVQEKVWQPALGRPATRRELESEARDKGWEPLGNEDATKHLKPPETEYPSFTDDDLRSLANK